jgi:UDPglucose 6-dehydrogenase
MKVAVIGTGYVGLVTGVVLSDLGNNVICVDNNPEKVKLLQQGKPPIFEAGLEEMLTRVLRHQSLQISDSIRWATQNSEIIFITVGTPPGPDGAPDLSAVIAVAEEIGKSIQHHVIVVNKSTVPVGSGDIVEKTIARQGVSSDLFDVVSNPEFLREGSAIQDTLNPDRIVIGARRRGAADKLLELYSTLESEVILTDLNSAELIKYGSNSFLAMKISFINALSRLCEECGANIGDVSRGMGLDKRIGRQFLHAGLGWGGSCFPKDVLGLIKISETFGYDFNLLKEVVTVNDTQTTHFLSRIEKRLGGFAGKRVALMGLAFKPDTDDIRDAKSLVLIDRLVAGGAIVVAYDPMAADHVSRLFPQVEYVSDVYSLANGADALIVVTEWNEFRQLDLARIKESMAQPILFDGRRLYSRSVAEQAGFEYFAVGG